MHKTSRCTLHASMSCLCFSEDSEIATQYDCLRFLKCGKKLQNLHSKTLSTKLFQKWLLLEPSEVYLCYCGEASCSIGIDYLALKLTIVDLHSSRKSPKAFVAGHKKCSQYTIHAFSTPDIKCAEKISASCLFMLSCHIQSG